MTTAIRVRDARTDDREIILDFNARLAMETEGKQLDRSVLRDGVDQALADPDRLRYWLAEIGERIVGQAAVTREWSDWRNGWIWWLQSVYVDQEHRGQGVLRAIIDQIRDAGRQEPDVLGLRLYVEEHNERAQESYRKLGMTPGGYLVYEQLWRERFSPDHPRS